MKILIDMNLTPDWAGVLKLQGLEAVHWSKVGDPKASDKTIMSWARERGYIVFTHDLDFGALLAATQAMGPSVIQLRTQDVSTSAQELLVVKILDQFQKELGEGALISIDPEQARVRILPIS